MSIFKARSDYFKSLSNKHIVVAHNREVDGQVRSSFFRMNDEEELTAGVVNWIHFPCVVHIGFAGRYTGDHNAVPKRKLSNSLLFLTKVDHPSDVDERETAYDTTFAIMEQFIAAIYNDYRVMGSCGQFDNIDLSRFSFNPVGPVGDFLFGWQLDFEDEVYADEVTTFDNSKWYPEGDL